MVIGKVVDGYKICVRCDLRCDFDFLEAPVVDFGELTSIQFWLLEPNLAKLCVGSQ